MIEAWQLRQARTLYGLGQYEFLDMLPNLLPKLVDTGLNVYNATQQQQNVAQALQQQAAQFQAQFLAQQQAQQQAQIAAQQQAEAARRKASGEGPFGIPLWGIGLGVIVILAIVFGAGRR